MAEMIKDTIKRYFGTRSGPMQEGPRDQLESPLRQRAASEPFTKSLFYVNRQLGMKGDNTLTDADAKRYVALQADVEAHRASNSYAFGSSAVYWGQQRKWGGATLNTLGWVASGALDHQNMKRGKY